MKTKRILISKNIDALCDNVVSIVTVTCSKCSKNDSERNTGTYYAALGFNNKGWKVVEDEVLCPTCYKTLNT